MDTGVDKVTGEAVQGFCANLRAAVPDLACTIDPPDDPRGEWWVDLVRAPFRASVVWRHGLGFGLALGEGGYGEGPDEIYRDPDLLVRRLRQLLESEPNAKAPHAMSLAEVRELIGRRQDDVARRLGIAQGAISRSERREDVKLRTLRDYVEALEGSVVILLRFKGCTVPLQLPNRDDGRADLR